MSLSPELFNEITNSVTIVGQEEPDAGGRKSQRLLLQTHVTLLPWNDLANSINVRIRDLSADGLGILHNKRMSLDDQFVVCFPRGKETLFALYTIVYWEPLAENLYAIGAQFDRVVEPGEIKARKAALTEEPHANLGVISRISQALSRTRKAS